MDGLSRRSVLGLAAAGSTSALTGCLDVFESRPEGVVLGPPEEWELLQGAELPHPVYGEPMPDVEVPDAFSDETVSPADYEGSRHVLATFFFTRCQATCPTLVSNLVQVQSAAAEDGWSDDVMLLAVTIDPEHDTPEVLQGYADTMGVDLGEDNFRFLRPESPEHAEEVVEDGFGGLFEESRIEDHADGDHEEDHKPSHEQEDGHEKEDDGDGTHGGHGQGGGESGNHDGQEFMHTDLTLFANRDGVVERAYTPNPPTAPQVVDDVTQVVEHYRE